MTKLNSTIIETYIRRILLEYSESEINKETARFVSENPDLKGREKEVAEVIRLFDKKRNNDYISKYQPDPNKAPKGADIRQYSWNELFSLLQKFNSMNGIFEVDKEVNEEDEEGYVHPDDYLKKIYDGSEDSDKKGLEIYRGYSAEQCIKVREFLEKSTGKKYNYCISKKDSTRRSNQNLYQGYRNLPDFPTFYFILDKSLPITDPHHTFVIHKLSSGKFKRTLSINTGDDEMSWDFLVKENPKLAGLENIFKVKPKTQKEKKAPERTPFNENDLNDLSYDQIKKIVESSDSLQLSVIEGIYNRSKELFNIYINLHSAVMIPYRLWGKLPSSTRNFIEKRWIHEVEENPNANLPGKYAFFLAYCNSNYAEKIIKDTQRVPLSYKDFEIYDIPEKEVRQIIEKALKMGANLSDYIVFDNIPENLKVDELKFVEDSSITQIPEHVQFKNLITNKQITFENPKSTKEIHSLSTTVNLKIPKSLKINFFNYNCHQGSKDDKIEIPDVKSMKHVSLFSGKKEIKEVVFPNNFKCSSLTIGVKLTKDVNIPENMKVENLSFMGNSNNDFGTGKFIFPKSFVCKSFTIGENVTNLVLPTFLQVNDSFSFSNLNKDLVLSKKTFCKNIYMMKAQDLNYDLSLWQIENIMLSYSENVTIKIPESLKLISIRSSKNIALDAPSLTCNTIKLFGINQDTSLKFPNNSEIENFTLEHCEEFNSFPKKSKIKNLNILSDSSVKSIPASTKFENVLPKSATKKFLDVVKENTSFSSLQAFIRQTLVEILN